MHLEILRNNNDREEISHSEKGKPTEEKPVSASVERIADEMAARGRARQRRDDKGVIIESDGH